MLNSVLNHSFCNEFVDEKEQGTRFSFRVLWGKAQMILIATIEAIPTSRYCAVFRRQCCLQYNKKDLHVVHPKLLAENSGGKGGKAK